LSNDEDTAEFAQEALDIHEMSALVPLPVLPAQRMVPVPEDLVEQVDLLLDLLNGWQRSLPNFQKRLGLEELSDIDRALSTLIVYLREAENGHL
jgi:hypothetical protein